MQALSKLTDNTYDVAVIGGGIIGAGVARDAALRGLSVALVEKSDFGSGTTSGSTRLIHGGLRYLEMFDFGLVRMDLRERETLLRIAPHLVKPLEFLIPFYGASLWFRAKMRVGMMLYDLLSYDKSLPHHRMLSAAETLAEEPSLRAEGLQGAAAYYDAQVAMPERLCLENILDAERYGAVLRSYTEVVGAMRESGRLQALRVRCTETGAEGELRAKVFVNATGAWFDRVARQTGDAHPPRIRTTKGIHITCERMNHKANVLFSPVDGRLFFVIPLLGQCWIGTTDTDFSEDPTVVRADGEDVEYLLRSVEPFFPQVRKLAIYSSNAGVRALVKQEGSASSVSRMHSITETQPGMISVLGGKITGYRAIAEEAVDAVSRQLGSGAPCRTHQELLPGALAPEPTGGAEALQRAVAREHCWHVADYLLRRRPTAFAADQGRGEAETAARLMGEALGWGPEQIQRELERYRAEADRALQYREEIPGMRFSG
ncbi:MAG: glycerol-3-phosphate dehydrogenase/oxidase [Acidobacteria bacterium]|jgi:glycerol-3-phosphate dehydrogenase|nr:glycerol-3-phosphate dehydrogenase/oxidase [Acidobacteriota bacterium]